MAYIVSKNGIIFFLNTSNVYQMKLILFGSIFTSIHVTSRIVSMTVSAATINDTCNKYRVIHYNMLQMYVIIFVNDINA